MGSLARLLWKGKERPVRTSKGCLPRMNGQNVRYPPSYLGRAPAHSTHVLIGAKRVKGPHIKWRMEMFVEFQDEVKEWTLEAFGEAVTADKIERNHRFLEESLELVQSLGCTKDEAHQLVDYVFGRDIGDPFQEVGGVMLTLAALCNANAMGMSPAAELELNRVWGKIDQIREKQASKPKHSPLPQ